MNRFELQQLRDLPIEGVAERLGLRLERHKSLCPFHDDHHASLFFNVRRNTCRCFACMNGAFGTIDLVMHRLGLNFREACQWLDDENNIIMEQWKPAEETPARKPFDAGRYERFFLRPWLGPEARRFLFDERRIDARVVNWCRLTSWQDRQGVDWLQIPYYDRRGKLIGVQNRNLQPGATPRFRFPTGAQCGIYNQPVVNLLRPGEPLFITEGCSDCWAMLSSGHKAIAIPSATLLKPGDMEFLRSLPGDTPLHMFPDCDEPGERLFRQLQKALPRLQHHRLPPGCKDYGEYYLSTGKEPGKMCLSHGKEGAYE